MYAIQVSSRAFQMNSPEGLLRVFFPWIDMANNGEDPNTMLTISEDTIHLHTLRPIAKGEEVRAGNLCGWKMRLTPHSSF